MAKLSMYRGDYREMTATVATSLDPDAEVHFGVKTEENIDPSNPSDSDALFTIDCTSADAVDNGDGTTTYTIVIDETKTEGKEPGDYFAEIEYISGAGRHTTYPRMNFTLIGDINQRD